MNTKGELVMNRLKQQIRLFGAAMVAAIALTACGGGGTGSNTTTTGPSSPSQGLWTGTTADNRSVTSLVLGDGSYYLIYSPVGTPDSIGGLVQGTGTASNGKFTSSNAVDFSFEGNGVNAASMSVDYTAKTSFNGKVTYTAGSTSDFTSTYNAAFETKPAVASITGTFNGQAAAFTGAAAAATLTVTAAGTLSGDCGLTGSISPRNDGNAYNVSIKFGDPSCAFANQTLSGVAYFDSATSTITILAPNAGRTDGVIFVGTGTGIGSGTGTGGGTGTFDPALVGIWTKSNQTLTLNANGTYSNNVIISGCGTYGVKYTESIDYGTFSTSGSSLTYVKSNGSVKSWSCSSMAAYPANPTSSSTSGGGFTSTVTYSITAGTGFGQQLIQDGIILTRQ
jgi:hypothetical protein